jgi:hypothetical protein
MISMREMPWDLIVKIRLYGLLLAVSSAVIMYVMCNMLLYNKYSIISGI